jgi:hypothetical protein
MAETTFLSARVGVCYHNINSHRLNVLVGSASELPRTIAVAKPLSMRGFGAQAAYNRRKKAGFNGLCRAIQDITGEMPVSQTKCLEQATRLLLYVLRPIWITSHVC